MLKDLTKGYQVCKLQKSLYGLKQSGRKWYKKLCAIFAKFGLKPTISDPCLFTRQECSKILIVGIHVDDALATANDPKIIQDFKIAFNRELKIKDMGEARYCLRIEFEQQVGRISLNQQQYVKRNGRKIRYEELHFSSYTGKPDIEVKSVNRSKQAHKEPTVQRTRRLPDVLGCGNKT